MENAEALFFANPFWVWIAIGGAFLVGELLSGSGWLLWPAGAAPVGGGGTKFAPGLGGPREIVPFVVVAIVATYVGRRFMRPAAKGGDINDPNPRLIGKQGEVV